MSIVVLDKKGRILIPKDIRESIGAVAGTAFIIRVENDKVILEKLGRPSERFARIFKPKKRVPEDLDEYAVEAIKTWWEKKQNT